MDKRNVMMFRFDVLPGDNFDNLNKEVKNFVRVMKKEFPEYDIAAFPDRFTPSTPEELRKTLEVYYNMLKGMFGE